MAAEPAGAARRLVKSIAHNDLKPWLKIVRVGARKDRMEESMSKRSWRRRPWAALIVLMVGFAGVVLGPSAARAYCNPNHQAWDLCYDGTKLKPPQERADKTLAHSLCEDLELRVAASIGQQACRSANVSDADAHGRAETISADGAGTFFLAQYLQAGIHTYIIRRNPNDVTDDAGLTAIAGEWGPQIEIQGFDLRRFRASVDGSDIHCAAFTKHWGHMPQTTGYRHRIAGVYCSAREVDTADDNLNELLGSIEPND